MLVLEPKEVASIAVGGFGALQKWEELALLLTEVEKIEPKVIVEIGLGKGGTLWAWSKIKSVKHIISIDLPDGPWGGENFPKTSATLQYIRDNSKAELSFIGGDSKDPQVIEKVREILGDDRIDFLMIDGDHSFKGVRQDYLNFSEMLSPNGITAFHDICEHSKESGCEVKQYWDQIKDLTVDKEFIVEPKTWGGIGVVY